MSAGRIAVLYARVSDAEKQDPTQALRALRLFAEGRGWSVHSEHADKVTGDPARRGMGDPPALTAALRALEVLKGRGVLVITSADRLVRSPLGVIQLVNRISALPAAVVSMEDGSDLDTTSDVGELMLFIRGWLARMELKLIRKRTQLALDDRKRQCEQGGFRSKRSGEWRTRLGRPSAVVDAAAVAGAIVGTCRERGGVWSVAEVARRVGMPRMTLRDWLTKNGIQKGGLEALENRAFQPVEKP